MGVAGSDDENRRYYEQKFGAFRSKPFPMPALVPSYIDKELAEAINDRPVPNHGLRLRVNTVPHAINSQTYQGRPAYTVSIMEFRNGKVVHETQYFADPFEAPGWRRQWVQQIA